MKSKVFESRVSHAILGSEQDETELERLWEERERRRAEMERLRRKAEGEGWL
jgi:hypothetical protein